MTMPDARSAHEPQPDVFASMRQHLAVWRQWIARIVVLAYAALAGTCVVLFARLTIRFTPGAAGSGIPQVMAALDTGVSDRERPLFVSLKLYKTVFPAIRRCSNALAEALRTAKRECGLGN